MSDYENTEVVLQKGGKVVRKVSIKKGKGYKSITKYRKGKKIFTIKKPIHKQHIKLIKSGKFIPGLFNDCKGCKTKKRRAGSDTDYDIEMGPEPQEIKPYNVPPDPERFKKQNLKLIQSSLSRPSSPEEAASIFEGPTATERERDERNKMSQYDTKDDPNWEELKIYKGGKSTRRRRRY